MFETISEKQKRVYDFYKKYIEENWVSPSYWEAWIALWVAPSVVFSYIRILERKWYLRRSGNWWVMLTASRSKRIPIVWKIACWEPIEVLEYVEDEIEVPETMFKSWYAWYALRAKWDSMRWAWIFDWDLLIIRHQNIVNDWDIAVVIVKDWFDEKATLKQVFRTPDAMVLMPKNPAFMPIYTNNCEIRWKLVWVIRQY
jgi:repressor LexA